MRDRVKELRRVPASALRPNPRNWRTHPPEQQAALRGVLDEVGFAGALLARELADGSLELVDGHLRTEAAPDALLPVLVLDVTEEEAAKLLATHDPLGAMAGIDREKLTELLEGIEFESPDLGALFDRLAAEAEELATEIAHASDRPEVTILEAFQVVVECADEVEQQAVYQQMRSEGYRCRVLTL